MDVSQLLKTYTDAIQSEEILKLIGKSLQSAKIIEFTPHFGNEKGFTSTALNQAIDQSQTAIDEKNTQQGFLFIGESLERHLQNQEKKVKQNLNLLLLTCGLAITILSFLNFLSVKISIAAVITFFLICILVFLFSQYQIQKNSLQPIQENLNQLYYVSSQLNLISYLEDEKMKQKFYQSLVNNMNEKETKVLNIKNFINRSQIDIGGNFDMGDKIDKI